jgi:hypothetical protein
MNPLQFLPRVLSVVCFLLGDSTAYVVYDNVSELCLFHLHRQVDIYLPMKMEQTEWSETLAYKLQTPVNHPDKSIQYPLTRWIKAPNMQFESVGHKPWHALKSSSPFLLWGGVTLVDKSIWVNSV